MLRGARAAVLCAPPCAPPIICSSPLSDHRRRHHHHPLSTPAPNPPPTPTSRQEEISDSRAQLAAVTLSCATLHHTRRFAAESYETLATKAAQYAAGCSRNPDQSRAALKASFLFAQPPGVGGGAGGEGGDGGGEGGDGEGGEGAAAGREPKQVLTCLQRALKVADASKSTGLHTPLFVEALDTYLIHFGRAEPHVTGGYIASLLQLIEQQLADGGDDNPSAAAAEALHRAKLHFANTAKYLEAKRAAGGRFAEIGAS